MATINKAYKYRLYPTREQKRMLINYFGQVRFVYNYFLQQRIDFYTLNKGKEKQSLNYCDTAKMLTQLKKQPDFYWLNKSNSQSLQQSLKHLDIAYQHFFQDGFKFPIFKKKSANQSFSIPQYFKIDTKRGLLKIPKLSPIKIVLHRKYKGKVKSVTISTTPSGKYFASVLCEVNQTIKLKKSGKKIGIDLGLKSFLVTSNGEKINPPKFLYKSEKKLKRLQQLLSRKVKGSKNRNKARIKVALMHEKIHNQRNDFLHKLSNRLVSENQAIFTEDLNVKGIMANRHLAKSVSDASWSEFIRQVKYKSNWYGTQFYQVDRFFPSSKKCNHCGDINDLLVLADREWVCKKCNQVHDRDINSAKNILQFGKLNINKVGKDIAKLKRPRRLRAVRRVAELGSPKFIQG